MGKSWWKPLWHGQPGGLWRLVVFFFKDNLKSNLRKQSIVPAPRQSPWRGCPARASGTVTIAVTSPSPSPARHRHHRHHVTVTITITALRLLVPPAAGCPLLLEPLVCPRAAPIYMYIYICMCAYICVHLFGRGTVEAKEHWLPGINPWGSRGRDLCSFPKVAKAR